MTYRILFVDDEQNVLDGLKRMLRDKRGVWEMIFVNDPLEALSWMEDTAIDVGVFDFNMPGMNGLKLLEKVKSAPHTRDMEIILLTGNEDSTLKRQGLDLGTTDLLNKPVQKEDLVARINSALRMRHYHRELQQKNDLLEQQLIKAQKMEVVGVMAAGAVHDLNNIISHISAYATLALMNLESNSEAREKLRKIEDITQHAGMVVRQIVNFSRNQESARIRTDLSTLIRDHLALIRLAVPKTITFEHRIAETPFEVYANPTEIYQVLMNLTVNANQAMGRKGSLTITLEDQTLPPQHLQGGSYMCLSVRDTGPGMSAETAGRIFEPMFTTKAPGEGTGLGLSVVQRIVENHHGAITVDSTPGVGTCFQVFFPAASAQNAPPVTQSEFILG